MYNSMNEMLNGDKNLRELIQKIRAARYKPNELEILLSQYESQYGLECNEKVIEIIAEDTRSYWAALAEQRGSNGINDLIATLWESFGNCGGEFTIERTDESAQVHVTYCPMVETYMKIGKPEFGLIFHCCTDPPIVEGFNPSMEFTITKRLMNGDDCCDHFYLLEK